MHMHKAKVDWIKYIWKVFRDYTIWVQMKLSILVLSELPKNQLFSTPEIVYISKEEAFVFPHLLKNAFTYLESLIISIAQITFCLLEEFKLIHV